LVAGGRNARKMIVVVSDEQRGGWDVDNAAAWQLATGRRTDGAASGADVKLYALPVAPDGKASDVAVADVSVAPTLIGLHRPAQVTATLTNSGPDPVRDLSVQFLVDGQAAGTQLVPNLPAGESRTIRFDHTFTSPGSHWLKVHADVADALDADNEAVVAANVWERLPVLVIDGQLSSAGDFRASQFLRAAMQPVADAAQDDRTLVQPKVVNVADAADEKLEDYAVVVVNDAARLPGELLAALADYARGGRAVWLIFGPRTERDFIARDLGDAGLLVAAVKARNEPAPGGGAAGAAGVAVEVKDPRHPTVQLIAAAERNALAGAVTRGWWALAPQSGDARVVLATAGGDPLVIERPIGNAGGRVVAWCTGADMAWNNWPVLPHFVPSSTRRSTTSPPARPAAWRTAASAPGRTSPGPGPPSRPCGPRRSPAPTARPSSSRPASATGGTCSATTTRSSRALRAPLRPDRRPAAGVLRRRHRPPRARPGNARRERPPPPRRPRLRRAAPERAGRAGVGGRRRQQGPGGLADARGAAAGDPRVRDVHDLARDPPPGPG
jgi:hypothetical protein